MISRVVVCEALGRGRRTVVRRAQQLEQLGHVLRGVLDLIRRDVCVVDDVLD